MLAVGEGIACVDVFCGVHYSLLLMLYFWTVDPLHVCGNTANLEDRTILFLHENRSQFPEEKISFVFAPDSLHSHDVQGFYICLFKLHILLLLGESSFGPPRRLGKMFFFLAKISKEYSLGRQDWSKATKLKIAKIQLCRVTGGIA